MPIKKTFEVRFGSVFKGVYQVENILMDVDNHLFIIVRINSRSLYER